MVLTKKFLEKITKDLLVIHQEKNKKENCDWKRVFGQLHEIIEDVVAVLPDSSYEKYCAYSQEFQKLVEKQEDESELIKGYSNTDSIISLICNRILGVLHYGPKSRYLNSKEGDSAKKIFKYVEPIGRGLFEFNKEKEIASLQAALALSEKAYSVSHDVHSDENLI